MADEVSWTQTLGGTYGPLTVTATITDTQDLLLASSHVIWSSTVVIAATGTWQQLAWPAALKIDGVCGIMLMADPGNAAIVQLSPMGSDTFAFAKLKVGGMPASFRPMFDAAYVATDTGTAESGTDTTMTDDGKAWGVNAHAGLSVKITAGTGSGQRRAIVSNTATALTVEPAWFVNPGADSVYTIEPLSDPWLWIKGTINDKVKIVAVGAEV